MKASEFAKILETVVRKVVREEMKPILTEMKNIKSINTTNVKPIVKEEFDPLDVSHILKSTKKQNPKFTENSMLNEILSETYESGEWKNMNNTTYTSNNARGFNREAMAEMMGYGKSNANMIPNIDPEGNPMNVDISGTPVEKALTRDYTQLMKAINDKKKK
jgi:hypothetical protein